MSFDLILPHQEFETLGVLGHDLVLAVLDGRPVQLARIDAFDAEFLGILQVIPKFGVEQQSFCGNAADVKARSAEDPSFSMSAVFRPYWPARMAAVYPAGPLPMNAMS